MAVRQTEHIAYVSIFELATTEKEKMKYFKGDGFCGHFQIWTRETLEQYDFEPRSASYYVVLHFDASKPIPMKKCPDLQKNKFTFRAKIRPLSDFMGIK